MLQNRKTRRALPIDEMIGKKIRERRSKLGITQTELANQVGVTFQQVQKYELSQNRISASRLWEVARALDVPISHFFEARDDTDNTTCAAEVPTPTNSKDSTPVSDTPG